MLLNTFYSFKCDLNENIRIRLIVDRCGIMAKVSALFSRVRYNDQSFRPIFDSACRQADLRNGFASGASTSESVRDASTTGVCAACHRVSLRRQTRMLYQANSFLELFLTSSTDIVISDHVSPNPRVAYSLDPPSKS